MAFVIYAVPAVTRYDRLILIGTRATPTNTNLLLYVVRGGPQFVGSVANETELRGF